MLLSIVIPVYNEAESITAFLTGLQAYRSQDCELIVVDGGSADNSLALASSLADQILQSDSGRARQMNAGAAMARGRWLLFLHADTYLPDSFSQFIRQLDGLDRGWGFFPVKLSGRARSLRVIERAISYRSAFTSVATGDQAMFVERRLFQRVEGFAALPLMEDVAMSKSLRSLLKPLVWPDAVTTSSRRWERDGVIRTVLLMWRLRLAYFLGVSPERLVRQYYG